MVRDTGAEARKGMLTFLLTDIEGSASLWEQYPQEMRSAMIRHDEVIEQAVLQFSGKVVRERGEGDSRFAVFPLAGDALAASIAIQRTFAAERWQIPRSLKIRIAMNTGRSDFRQGDYYGTTVNRCARIRDLAFGGQTLISLATFNSLQRDLTPGISFRDMGEHKLRDLQEPERIYQLVIDGLHNEFPPLKSQGGTQNNLPSMLTSFIGREREINEIKRLVSSTRLFTILGAGGSGKTRLSLQVASELLGRYPNGIWFCDLGPLSNSSLVAQHLSNTLNIREEEGRPLLQTLVNYLRDKDLLLILDNCEHLIPAVSQVANEILLGSPNLRILATSREPLGVAGEVQWWIPAMSFPDPGEMVELEDLLQYEAVELFLSRAKAVDADFVLNEKNIQAILRICAHLDGIPLAIELAVARLSVLTVEEIAERLGERFQLLVGSRAALQRQQTLQALIDWSYDLLTENERILFRRLSVFAGGATMEAIEVICSKDPIKKSDQLDLLARLINKSLLIAKSHEGKKRYQFLETIQQYSQNHLEECGEAGQFQRRHAYFFLKMVVASYAELWGPKQGFWLSQLEADHANLRKALEWLAQGNDRKKSYLRMAGSLWRFWSIRGYFDEGRSWLENAIDKNPDAPPRMLAHSFRGAGILASQQGDYSRAREYHERSLSLFRQINDTLGEARELSALGEIAQVKGRYGDALQSYEASLSLMEQNGDKEGIAVVRGHMGNLARDRGRYHQSREFLQDSLKLSRELGDKQLIALALKNLGITQSYLSEYQVAMDILMEAVSLYEELKDDLGISNALQHMGHVAKDLGDFNYAKQLFEECLELKLELGDRLGIAYALGNLAEIAFFQGKYLEVENFAEQSLGLFKELDAKRGMLFVLGISAYAAHYQGSYGKAQSLVEECLHLAAEIEARRSVAYCTELVGLLAFASGELEQANTLLLEASDEFKELGDRRSTAMTSINLARVAYRQRQHERAAGFLNESLSLARELRTTWTVGFALEIMGLIERDLGHYQRALELFKESLQISIEQDNRQGIANCLGAMAGLAVTIDKPALAASLFAAAQATREEIGARMAEDDQAEYDRYLDRARQQLNDMEYQTACELGRYLSPDQIVGELSAWFREHGEDIAAPHQPDRKES